MDHPEFRKLRMRLPRQPLTPQRPWLIAGIFLVFIILLIATYGYFSDKERSEVPEQQKKISSAIGSLAMFSKPGRHSGRFI